MGRPKGHKLSQESKDKAAASHAARNRLIAMAKEVPWIEISGEIQAAFEAGDAEKAIHIYHRFMKRHSTTYNKE